MGYSTATDANRRMCVTCQFWRGDREIWFCSSRDIRVRYNNNAVPCTAWNTNRNGACNGCNRYKRWVELP